MKELLEEQISPDVEDDVDDDDESCCGPEFGDTRGDENTRPAVDDEDDDDDGEE